MGDYAFFYDSNNGDRVYNASDFEHWLKKFFTSGVFTGDLQVTANGNMTVNVSAGYCNADGKVRFFDTDTTLSIGTANASLGRIDCIVIERNDAERNVTLKVVQGIASATPIAVAPVRSGGIYQLVLAKVTIPAGAVKITQTNIRDVRENTELCGLVTGTVKEIDASHLRTQFDAICAEEQADFEIWFNEMKNQLSTDAAGNLQKQIEVERERINNLAKMEEGSTTGDAELMDIRAGADGINYPTAGEAVRRQFESAKEYAETRVSEIHKEFEFIPVTSDDVRKGYYAPHQAFAVGYGAPTEREYPAEKEDHCIFETAVEMGDALILSNSFHLSSDSPYIMVIDENDIVVEKIYFDDIENGMCVFGVNGRIVTSFVYTHCTTGEYFYIKKVATNEPLVLYADKASEYENDSSIGEKALKYIMEGKQIYVRVPNADGGDYTAIYSPVLTYQLPNKMNSYLYLFFLKDEKQDLSALGLTGVQLPAYGQLKLKLSRDYNQTPLL